MNPLLPDSMLRFVPARADGLPDVSEAAVYPDRLELVSAGKRVSFPFRELARWPRPRWLWRLLSRIGCWPRWLPIGERDWFHPPGERFIRFYTNPPITICMPEDPHSVYHLTLFRRVQDVIALGGYGTIDLG